MHPLTPNLSELTDEELSEKLRDLNNRLTNSYRMGHTSMCGQLHMILEDYMFEQQRRNQKVLDDLQKNHKDFSDKISISK
jgi:hypothetical protein